MKLFVHLLMHSLASYYYQIMVYWWAENSIKKKKIFALMNNVGSSGAFVLWSITKTKKNAERNNWMRFRCEKWRRDIFVRKVHLFWITSIVVSLISVVHFIERESMQEIQGIKNFLRSFIRENISALEKNKKTKELSNDTKGN